MIGTARVVAAFVLALILAAPLRGQHMIGNWHGELAKDDFGLSLAMLGDVDSDGVCDFAMGSWHPGGTYDGAVYVYSGASGLLIRRIDAGQSGEQFGNSLAALNDVDGDGVPDMAIGAPIWQENGVQVGRVCVYSGATGAFVWYQPGQGYASMFGRGVARVGDIDGDGADDLVTGAPYIDNYPWNWVGAAYVLSGKTGTILFSWIGDDDHLLLGNSAGSAGDADGDGIPDVAVGAQWYSGSQQGRVYLYSGKDGTLLHTLSGANNVNLFGLSIAPMGDLNGDGCADLAIGTWLGTDVFLYSGRDAALIDTIHGDPTHYGFGLGLASAGDLDGDGLPELIVGDPYDSSLFTDGGSIHLINGRTRRELYRFNATFADGEFGNASAGGQDVDGDGVADILSSAPFAAKGRARLFAGNDLFLQTDPPDPAPLTTLTLSTRAGVPGSLALMTLEELDGAPLFLPLQLTTLDANGEWILSANVPSGLTGHTVGLRTYAQKDPTLGGVIATDLANVAFQ
jgi:VCBS repeat protein/FG-GAP repeat protein